MQSTERALVEKVAHRVNQMDEFLDGKTPADFEADRVLQLPVEHNYWLTGKLISRLITGGGETAVKASELVTQSQFDLDYADRLVTENECVKVSAVWSSLQLTLPVLKQRVNVWVQELA